MLGLLATRGRTEARYWNQEPPNKRLKLAARVGY
jgi:hypothetical protein